MPATRRAVESVAQHEVVGRLEVGVRVGDDFQQGVVQAEDAPWRRPAAA